MQWGIKHYIDLNNVCKVVSSQIVSLNTDQAGFCSSTACCCFVGWVAAGYICFDFATAANARYWQHCSSVGCIWETCDCWSGFKIKSQLLAWISRLLLSRLIFSLAVNNEYSISLLCTCLAMADDFKFLEPVVNTFVPGNFPTHFLQIPAC